MTMSCLHSLHAAPLHHYCHHHHQQGQRSADVPCSSHFGRHWTKVEYTQPHSFNKPYGVVSYISSVAVAAGHHHQPCRIVPCFSCGAKLPMAEMRVKCSRSPSICSTIAQWGLRWEIPAAHIFLPSSRKKGAGLRAPMAIVCTAQETQMISNPKFISSTCSRNSARALRGRTLVDPNLIRGGAAAMKGNKSVGDNDAEGDNERDNDEGKIRPSGRNLGRRAATLLGASILWSGSGCCRICEEALAEQHWDYGGPCGPAKWEGMCTSGSKQSPVDITSSNTKDGGSLGVLNFFYAPSTVSVKNTGHGTIQASFGKPSNFLRVRGHTLQLLQFHFHAPSEHAFDGERYPMEAHLVHRDPVTRKFVVVGVMLDASKTASPNKCLAISLAYVPQEHGLSMDAPIKVSPSFLLPPSAKDGSRGYVHYSGSLTTPPCSEGVEWFVLDTPIKISSSQVVDFLHFSGDGHTLAFNSRPLQPLGKRTVFKGP